MSEPIVQDLFGAVAERHPERIAILSGQGRVLYRELEEQANRVANGLLEGGALPGAVVAVWVGTSVHVVTSILGTLRAGCVFMPLDAGFPNARLAAMLDEARPSWVIVDQDLLAELPRLAALAPRKLRVLGLDVAGAALPAGACSALDAATARPAAGSDPEAMCSVYFTSGSTGRPKAIAGRLKGIGHFVQWEIGALDVVPGTRTSQLVSPAFDGYLRDVFVPLLAGGTLCVPERREMILDPSALLRFLDQTGIEVLHCVPSLFRALLNEPLVPTMFPALRAVALFGEPLLPADVDRFMGVFGDRIRLVNLYGPTETTMVKLAYEVQAADRKRRVLPVGKPIPGCEVLVLDERGRPCPVGVVGEVYLRTAYRSLGYLNRPELTREVFVPNPLTQDAADIVYRTGDFGRSMADGNLEFLGRRDGQVKIRGVRIEPAEIESCLREHGSVRDVAVVDREDGSGGRMLCAYVVSSGELEVPVLRQHLAGRLPEVMIPARFVAMAALPRTLNGKIDRKALPEPPRSAGGSGSAGPEGPTEELLVQIWSELLGLEEVSRHASFFEVGGHSLMAMQLLTRMRAAFGVELPVRELFDGPSLANLAGRVDELRRSGSAQALPALAAVSAETPVAASFGQAELYRRFAGEGWSAGLGLPVSFAIAGRLEHAILRASFETLVAEHGALRTTLHEARGALGAAVLQRHEPAGRVELPVVDLSALPAVERAALEPRLLARRLGHGPGGGTLPALRVWVLRFDLEDHRLQLLFHGAVVDEASLQLLHRELVAHYRAGGGRPAARLSFRDLAAWQGQRELEGAFDPLLAVWRRRLDGAGPALALASGAEAAETASEGPAAVHRRELGEEPTQALRQAARRERATPFLLLLAAFLVALQRATGRNDLIVGIPFSGRVRAGSEGMIGPLARLLPLRAQLAATESAGRFLAELRERILETQAHQEVPLERLYGEVWTSAGRSTERFPVRFVYQTVALSRAGEVEALALRPGTIGTVAQRCELVLRVIDHGRGLRLLFEHRADRLPDDLVAALATDVMAVLDGLQGDPERRLEQLGAELTTPGVGREA